MTGKSMLLHYVYICIILHLSNISFFYYQSVRNLIKNFNVDKKENPWITEKKLCWYWYDYPIKSSIMFSSKEIKKANLSWVEIFPQRNILQDRRTRYGEESSGLCYHSSKVWRIILPIEIFLTNNFDYFNFILN